MKDTAEILSHEQVSALLPWLINGSLSENEKDALMEHANSCLDCRREAKQLKALQAALSRESALSSVPRPKLSRMMKRIEEYEDCRTFNPVARLMDYCTRNRRSLLAAQGVAIVVIVALFMWPATNEPQFRTLTQIENLSSGSYIRTVFKPGISESDLMQFMANYDLDVVSGPSARGVYTLGTQRTLSSKEIDKLALALRGNPEVLFAESLHIRVEP